MRVPVQNRRGRVGILAFVVVVALAIAWVLLGPGEAPAGQPPVVTLDSTSLEALRTDFNRDANQPRVIVLLSPT